MVLIHSTQRMPRKSLDHPAAEHLGFVSAGLMGTIDSISSPLPAAVAWLQRYGRSFCASRSRSVTRLSESSRAIP